MNHWWRAYNTAASDPKLGGLSDWQHRCWFQIMCMSSDNGGTVPSLTHVAYTLRVKPEKAAEVLTQLHAAGLLDKDDVGFVPHNWKGRQYKSDTSTDRVKRFRNGKRNVSCNEAGNAPEQSRAETEQSRADAGGKISVSEKVLKTDLMEAFGPSRTPDLSRASVWLAKGYSTTLILEVVRDGLARKPDIATLNYFDAALEDKHATRPESPSERAAAQVDMDKVAEMFKKTGVWSRYAGPEPGMTGCRCPPEILSKYQIVVPGARRMAS
jgi:hypothetical protein